MAFDLVQITFVSHDTALGKNGSRKWHGVESGFSTIWNSLYHKGRAGRRYIASLAEL